MKSEIKINPIRDRLMNICTIYSYFLAIPVVILSIGDFLSTNYTITGILSLSYIIIAIIISKKYYPVPLSRRKITIDNDELKIKNKGYNEYTINIPLDAINNIKQEQGLFLYKTNIKYNIYTRETEEKIRTTKNLKELILTHKL
jgi:hypothetical protein